MKIFEVSLTNYCNFKCDYCISDKGRGNDKFSEPLKLNEDGSLKIHPEGMLHEDYVRLRDTAHDSGDWLNLPKLLEFIKTRLDDSWVVNLTGGEPLYYPKIDSFFLELVKTNKVVVTTNGSLIKNHKELLEIDRDSIFFRIGYHPEFRSTNEFIRNMQYIIENGFKYIVNYVLHPAYYIEGSTKYVDHIKILVDNNLTYEVTPFEGDYKNKRYPTPEFKRSNVEKYILSSHQLSKFTSSPMGDKFLLAEPQGIIYECQGKGTVLGNVYNNEVNLIKQPRPQCFIYHECSPAKSANHYLKLFLNEKLDV